MWPLDSKGVVSCWQSIWKYHVSHTVVEILSFKVIWVTTLTFWGHVTPSVTWPLDSPYSVSYRWSIRTNRLSRTVIEILRFKCIGVTTLTFRVTWRHRSCDHWILKVWFPIGSQYESTMYLSWLSRYWGSKICGSRPWPFGVTWRHRSCDRWIPKVWFLIGSQYEPTMYLTRLLRY